MEYLTEFAELKGYKWNARKTYASYALTVLTLGFLQLLLYWKPVWKLKMTHSICSPKSADKVLIKDQYGLEHVEDVVREYTDNDNGVLSLNLTFFLHQNIKYIWVPDDVAFVPLRGRTENISCSTFYQYINGLSDKEAEQKLNLYGLNAIKVPVKPVWWLLCHEGLSPFYIFQLYACIVWFLQQYWSYTLAILFLSIMSLGISVYEMRKQSKTLRDTVRSKSSVTVLRNQTWLTMSSESLVPGDVIQVPTDGTLECDAVLLDGIVVVSESMLTGESIPVTKTAILDDPLDNYSPEVHRRHTLFCSANVLQANPVDGSFQRAVVLRTGFSTTKGELVRSIMFPKPTELKFYTDGMKLCLVSALLGLIAVVYTAVMFILNGASLFQIIMNTLDIMTFVVPASLPAVLTVSVIYSQKRLNKLGIYCLSSKYINMSGTLDMVCFDKTGTLTSESLDLREIVPSQDSFFRGVEKNAFELPSTHLSVAMATCHSLTKIGQEIIGSPLDKVLFDAVKWEFSDAVESLKKLFTCTRKICYFKQQDSISECDGVYALVHQYPFSSFAQRMSVIVQESNTLPLWLYVKGAPEKIASLCDPATVPQDLYEVLQRYTSQGYRVISCACKCLDPGMVDVAFTAVSRDELEVDMTFLGLIVLQNTLIPATIPALVELQEANIRVAMVTGDNLMTGIHVARKCGMINSGEKVMLVKAKKEKGNAELEVTYKALHDDQNYDLAALKISELDDFVVLDITAERVHFVLDGPTFELLQSEPKKLLPILQHGTVFGRMLPEQKAQLVCKLQEIGHKVGMCGDGANDCGALKTADTGVSLCAAEASVAAPFTSKTQDISCVPALIKEGRCSLVTSCGLFKDLVGGAWVYCVGILILAEISSDLLNFQYLYNDIVVVMVPAIFIPFIEPYKKLSPHPPPNALISPAPLLSLFAYILIQTIFLSSIWLHLLAQPWYEEWVYNEENWKGYENTTMFMALQMSLLLPAVIFVYGHPYQQRIYTNKLLCLCLVVLTLLCVCIMFWPNVWTDWIFELYRAPTKWYYFVLAMLGLLNLTFSLFVEDVLINLFFFPKVLPFIKNVMKKKVYEPFNISDEVS